MTSPSAVPPTPERMADFYDGLSPLLRMAWGDNFHFGYWDGPSDGSSVEEATDRFTDLLAERLVVGSGDVVLDVGCGVGRPALRVASLTGARVVGVTISRQQVEQAGELARVAGMGGRVVFEYGDGMALRFGVGSFDAVLALESIVHMDRVRALGEMARVLKPGGRLVLTDVFTLDDDAPPVSSADSAADSGQSEDPEISSWLRTMDDYPALVAGAGLVLDELTDVTGNIEGTFSRMIDGFIKHRREFERKHGMTLEEVFDHGAMTRAGAPGVGCLVMVAHKP
jgi:cyclopropane fatty-acyl-phospholipid synthase-like methyltransferase